MIKFTIPGPPIGKGRPKFTRCGSYTHTYTPPKTANYEMLVQWYFMQSQANKIIGSIVADIEAYMPIPKSTSKKQRAMMIGGIIRPAKKPDWDNIGKIICDALNKLAYDDDSAVVDGRVRKYYSDDPRVEVTLTEVNYDRK